jgi:dihydrofolate reductase
MVVYYAATSLDGYIARSDGGIDWLTSRPLTEDYGYADFYASIDAMLCGRKTYDLMCGFPEYPYPGKPCHVFSRTLQSSFHPDVILVDTNPRQYVRALKKQSASRIWLIGGAALAGELLPEIDEIIVSIIPVVIGSGIPLFAHADIDVNLSLKKTTTYQDGVVQLHYTR